MSVRSSSHRDHWSSLLSFVGLPICSDAMLSYVLLLCLLTVCCVVVVCACVMVHTAWVGKIYLLSVVDPIVLIKYLCLTCFDLTLQCKCNRAS